MASLNHAPLEISGFELWLFNEDNKLSLIGWTIIIICSWAVSDLKPFRAWPKPLNSSLAFVCFRNLKESLEWHAEFHQVSFHAFVCEFHWLTVLKKLKLKAVSKTLKARATRETSHLDISFLRYSTTSRRSISSLAFVIQYII